MGKYDHENVAGFRKEKPLELQFPEDECVRGPFFDQREKRLSPGLQKLHERRIGGRKCLNGDR
jgi:hypothetical protein